MCFKLAGGLETHIHIRFKRVSRVSPCFWIFLIYATATQLAFDILCPIAKHGTRVKKGYYLRNRGTRVEVGSTRNTVETTFLPHISQVFKKCKSPKSKGSILKGSLLKKMLGNKPPDIQRCGLAGQALNSWLGSPGSLCR